MQIMGRFLFRVVVLAFAGFYLWVLSSHAVDGRDPSFLSAKDLANAGRRDPGNSVLFTEQGRRALAADDATTAIPLLSTAVRLNPVDLGSWDLLTRAHLTSGNGAAALASAHDGLTAVPHSAASAWSVANLLIVHAEPKEAVPYLRTVIADAPTMRAAAFSVSWKVFNDGDYILREIVPANNAARASYLRFCSDKGMFADGYKVWETLRGSGRMAVDEGNRFVDRLASAGAGSMAGNVWDQLLREDGRQAAKPPGQVVTNGDFELPVTNTGLDWHLSPVGGSEVNVDDSEAQLGTHSLAVVFDGRQNPDFTGAWQFISVTPGVKYRLSAYVKTEKITTSNGVKVCVGAWGDRGAVRAEQCTPDVTGTVDWQQQQLTYTASEGTQVARVAFRRIASTKLDNRLGGKAWLDNVSMVVEEPGRSATR